MNTKNKKIIASIIGIVAGVVVISNLLYAPINEANNEYTNIASTIYNIKECTIRDKQALLNLQDKMMKLNKDKDKIIQIDSIIEEIERADYEEESKVNDYVKQLDRLNEEIDNIIDIYNNDENMKKDIDLSDTMMEIDGTNNLIDDLMNKYNKETSVKFNESINKFPVNIVAKYKGWFEVDKFSSVN